MARKTDQMKCDFDAQQVFGEIVKTIKQESEMIRSGSPDSLRAIREALAEIIKEDALLEKRRTNERLKEKELKREEDAYNKELRTSLHQMHSREAVGLGRRRGGDEPGARRTSVFGKLGGVLAGAGATLAAGVGLTSIANRVAGEAKEPPTDRPQSSSRPNLLETGSDRPQSSSRPNLLETGLGATIVQTIRQESEMIRSGSPDSLRTIREALMEMSTREQNVNADLQRKETEREQTADNEAIISQLGNISDTLKEMSKVAPAADGEAKKGGGLFGKLFGGLGIGAAGIGIGIGAAAGGIGLGLKGLTSAIQALDEFDAEKATENMGKLLSIADHENIDESGKVASSLAKIGAGLLIFGSGAAIAGDENYERVDKDTLDRFSGGVAWSENIAANVAILLGISETHKDKEPFELTKLLSSIGAGLAVFGIGSGAAITADSFARWTGGKYWAARISKNVDVLMAISETHKGKEPFELTKMLSSIALGLAVFGIGSGAAVATDTFARWTGAEKWATTLSDNINILIGIGEKHKDKKADVLDLTKLFTPLAEGMVLFSAASLHTGMADAFNDWINDGEWAMNIARNTKELLSIITFAKEKNIEPLELKEILEPVAKGVASFNTATAGAGLSDALTQFVKGDDWAKNMTMNVNALLDIVRDNQDIISTQGDLQFEGMLASISKGVMAFSTAGVFDNLTGWLRSDGWAEKLRNNANAILSIVDENSEKKLEDAKNFRLIMQEISAGLKDKAWNEASTSTANLVTSGVNKVAGFFGFGAPDTVQMNTVGPGNLSVVQTARQLTQETTEMKETARNYGSSPATQNTNQGGNTSIVNAPTTSTVNSQSQAYSQIINISSGSVTKNPEGYLDP